MMQLDNAVIVAVTIVSITVFITAFTIVSITVFIIAVIVPVVLVVLVVSNFLRATVVAKEKSPSGRSYRGSFLQGVLPTYVGLFIFKSLYFTIDLISVKISTHT
jgi:hypothetical protein